MATTGRDVGGVTAEALVMAAVVLGTTKQVSLLTAPIRWYGRHSYEVYLTNEFIVVWGVLLFSHVHSNSHPGPKSLAQQQIGLLHMLPWVIGILLLTAPLGWLVARFISEPANRLLLGAQSSRVLDV